jgi:nucleoside-diphosphate-sugar epimerase
MKQVGITGATGRIASILLRHLKGDYHFKLFSFEKPECTDAETLSQTERETHGSVVVVDLADRQQVVGLFEGLDVVIHLAAYTLPHPFPEQGPQIVFQNNIEATYHVLEECAHANVKRLIFASTNHTQNGSMCVDPSDSASLDLERIKPGSVRLRDLPFPDSLYGVSKLCGEDLCKFFSQQKKLETVVLRIGWIRLNDDPSDLKGRSSEAYMRAIYLSHQDAVGFFRAAIEAEMKPAVGGIPFMMAYAVSNNEKKIYDLEETIANLGYCPRDNADSYFQ